MISRVFCAWMLLGALCVGAAQADDGRRFGSSRSRDYGYGHGYGRDGYTLPRQQPVMPTRPFFVQPYPRNDGYGDSRGAYRHGYREGYGDGYADRDRRGRDYDDDRGWGPRGGYGDRGWNRGYRNQPNAGYYDGYPGGYYAPRPGVSIYYRDR